jgi:hypothetical protein
MSTWVLLVLGALAGLHAATWGGFKDSPFEGFRPASFVRSLALAIGCAVLVDRSGVVAEPSDLLVALGLCYAGERLVTEWWKAILREDRQSAYSIPMRLALGGRPVDARIPRYTVGVLVAGGLVMAFALAGGLEHGSAPLPWWASTAVAGIGGWLTAVGGAWKDAPVEGFELAKFFRSPAVATAWGAVLLPTSVSLTVLAVAAGGMSVVTIETYKTFLAGGPPGKFAGKPSPYDVGAARAWCRRVHGGLYAVLVVALAAAALHRAGAESTGSPAGRAAGLAVLVWASAWAALVLAPPKSATVEESSGPGPTVGPPRRLSDADIRGASG